MQSFATKHNDPDAKLGWAERIGYGTSAFGWNMINGIIGTFLTFYFTNVALLDAAVISTLIAVSKVFDGVSDLVVGNIVDRTKSKLGKARSWLLRMCIPFAVSVSLLFFVPAGPPIQLIRAQPLTSPQPARHKSGSPRPTRPRILAGSINS